MCLFICLYIFTYVAAAAAAADFAAVAVPDVAAMIAMASPCYCNVIAMSLPCHCHGFVMSLPCRCPVYMPCHCHDICPTVCVMIFELFVAAWFILSACWHVIAMFLTIDHVIATHTRTHANTHPRTHAPAAAGSSHAPTHMTAGGRRQDHSGALSRPLPSRALLATVCRATCSCIACGW